MESSEKELERLLYVKRLALMEGEPTVIPRASGARESERRAL